MRTVFIFHGIEGHPGENWFPWLKKELALLDCRVMVPAFPHPANPILSEWLDFFEDYKEMLTTDTILIGHSLGVAFLLHVLEHYSVEMAFLVSGFAQDVPNAFNERMGTFFHTPFLWDAIRLHCPSFEIFHSDNDPYVPLNRGEMIARQLGVSLQVIPNGGHLNAAAGYTTFPLLLGAIRKRLKKALGLTA